MIDQDLKRSLGQMMKGVQVVASAHDGIERGYCSHWVCQVSFEEGVADGRARLAGLVAGRAPAEP